MMVGNGSPVASHVSLISDPTRPVVSFGGVMIVAPPEKYGG